MGNAVTDRKKAYWLRLLDEKTTLEISELVFENGSSVDFSYKEVAALPEEAMSEGCVYAFNCLAPIGNLFLITQILSPGDEEIISCMEKPKDEIWPAGTVFIYTKLQ